MAFGSGAARGRRGLGLARLFRNPATLDCISNESTRCWDHQDHWAAAAQQLLFRVNAVADIELGTGVRDDKPSGIPPPGM